MTPEAWVEARFSEINDFKSASVNPDNSPRERFELYSVPAFPSGEPEVQPGSAIGSTKQAVRPGDVLVCKINPRINRVWTVMRSSGLRQIASSEWIVMRPNEVHSMYLRHYFTSPRFRALIGEGVSGVGGSLTRAQPSRVGTFPIPLAPLNEQMRIAEKLDGVLTRVDTCRERLDRVPDILKRFRQSVLVAATTGELTQGWRDASASDASSLVESLHRLRIDARKVIESPPDLSVLPNKLPEGWRVSTLDLLIERIEAGKSFTALPRPAAGGEWGVIKVSAMSWGRFLEQENKAVPEGRPVTPRHEIQPGDLLISRANTAELAGAAVLVGQTRPRLLLSDKSLRLVPYEGIDKGWLNYVLRAPSTRQQFTDRATGTSNSMRNLSHEKILATTVALPSTTEQREIVRRVERLFAYAERLEAGYNMARTQVERLAPALLAKAFRGELVPQDPNDEPASVLLERINAARAKDSGIGSTGSVTRTTRRPRPLKAAIS